jgi:hypothetical protein
MEHDAKQLRKGIRERLKADFDFHERHDGESKGSLFRQIGESDLYAVFYSDSDDNELHLGFFQAGEIGKLLRKSLTAVLKNLSNAYFEDIYNWETDSWLTRKFYPLKFSNPHTGKSQEETVEYFLEQCQAIVDEAENLDL